MRSCGRLGVRRRGFDWAWATVERPSSRAMIASIGTSLCIVRPGTLYSRLSPYRLPQRGPCVTARSGRPPTPLDTKQAERRRRRAGGPEVGTDWGPAVHAGPVCTRFVAAPLHDSVGQITERVKTSARRSNAESPKGNPRREGMRRDLPQRAAVCC